MADEIAGMCVCVGLARVCVCVCVCSYVRSRALIRFPCVSAYLNVNNRMWAFHAVIPILSS